MQRMFCFFCLLKSIVEFCIWQIPDCAKEDGEISLNRGESIYLNLKEYDTVPKTREILYKDAVEEQPKKVKLKVCEFMVSVFVLQWLVQHQIASY